MNSKGLITELALLDPLREWEDIEFRLSTLISAPEVLTVCGINRMYAKSQIFMPLQINPIHTIYPNKRVVLPRFMPCLAIGSHLLEYL